jgi:hypothetical protein
VAARQRPGPQPKPAITEAVRGIFQRIVPPGVRPIEKIEELGDAMDEAKNPPIPIPPTWKNRSVPLRTWSHAAETEPDIALKAMKSRLNPRVAGPDRAN